MSYTEPTKRKNKSPLQVLVNAWGCLLGLVMLGLGGAIGLLGAIFIAPQLLGFNLTATALAEQQIVLAATAVDLDERARDAEAQATTFALEVQATQAIILNEYELLGQTATQSSNNIRATGTAMAQNSSARQTQVVMDYSATQAQLVANATEAGINILNTQAALGIPQSSNNQNQSAINPYDFAAGLDMNYWQLSANLDWQTTENGLEAIREDAWLLENEARLLPVGDYALDIQLQHSLQPHSEYWILLVDDRQGMAVYLRAEGRIFAEAGIYSFDLANLENGTLSLENAALLSRVTANSNLGEEMLVELDLDGSWMRLALNGDILLLVDDVTLNHGRFGIQMPLGAILQGVERQ